MSRLKLGILKVKIDKYSNACCCITYTLLHGPRLTSGVQCATIRPLQHMKKANMQNRTYRILDHLASVLRLTRHADKNPQDDEFWSNIEDELWSAYWYRQNSEYDNGTSQFKIDTVVKLLENIEREKIGRLKPLPQLTYTMIREVLKREGFMKQEF